MTFEPISLKGLRVRAPRPEGAPRKLLHYLGNGEALLEIDNSSIEAQTTCDRSAEFKLVYSRIGEPSYALTYGGIWHRCLEKFYQWKQRQQNLSTDDKPEGFNITEVLAEAEAEFVKNPAPLGGWRTYEKLAGAFHRYVERYAREDDFTVERCEQPFSWPLTKLDINAVIPYDYRLVFDNPEDVEREDIKGIRVNPSSIDALPLLWYKLNGTVHVAVKTIHVNWTGVIDMVLRYRDELWIMDHKTTSIEGDTFWKNFELSQQFLGYHWTIEKILNERVSGAVANVIYGREDAKTPAGVKTQREKEFLRRWYHYLPEHVSEWETNMIRIMQDFAHNLCSGSFPMKTAHCTNKFGLCQYHDICTLRPENRLKMLATSQYYDNVWNPLG